jgi:hypothetical protein
MIVFSMALSRKNVTDYKYYIAEGAGRESSFSPENYQLPETKQSRTAIPSEPPALLLCAL